ncbi:MAG: DUF3488 and transglutaminase-like domain-containing protein [Deltaproteobacteria bacterium]
MRISNALAVFTHLIALTGFLAISLTAQVGLPVILLFSVSIILSFINERYDRNYYLGSGLSTILAIFLVIYVAINVLLLGVELFKGILDFLIFIQIIKLLSKKSMRDVVQIYVLSFFQFLAGTIITVNFYYAFAFVIYIAVAIWAIMVFQMRKESLEAENLPGDDPELITPLFLSTTFVVGFCIFLIAALIFVSVPRLGGSYLKADFMKAADLRTGFSDEVRLGRVGEIKLDSSPVMMVSILGRGIEDVPNPIYWRGIALDEFDGAVWRAGEQGYMVYRAAPRGGVVIKDEIRDELLQEIITEPIDTDVLFAANMPAGYRAVPGGRVASINDSYILPDRMTNRIKYFASSEMSVPSSEELRNDNSGYPDDALKKYLQLPELGERVKELAMEITSNDGNNYDRAVSVRRYLVTNYNYTRTLEEGTDDFPLEDFLFGIKEGHCEYFATAMVILLREAGVPARIVNGFIGGKWNEHGEFFLVRESDAHSWVEVLFPEYGWVTFDPTPEGGEAGTHLLLSAVSSYMDYLRFRWSRYVIDFSQRDQVRLLSGVRDKWRWQNRKISSALKFKIGFDKRYIAVAAVIVFFAWIIVTRPQLKPLFLKRDNRLENKASRVYRDALKLMSGRGHRKPEYMTPREFAEFLSARAWPGAPVMNILTDKYLGLRFGKSGNERDIAELKDLLVKLKTIKK